MLDAPRLHPCADALLKVGNNALGHSGVNVFSVEVAHLLFSFWVWVAMKMQPCPSARSGVAERRGARWEGNHPGCTSRSFRRGSLGKPTVRRSFTLAWREGQRPLVFGVFELVFFRERDRYRMAETTGSGKIGRAAGRGRGEISGGA